MTKPRANGKLRVVTLAASVLGVGAITCSAEAADLPDRTTPPVFVAPTPAFSWSGFYVGINGGYGFDHVPYNYELSTGQRAPNGNFAVNEFSSHGINERGPLAGAQIGYNSELLKIPYIGPVIGHLPILGDFPMFTNFLSHIVIGTELDADWSDINGSNTVTTGVGTATFGTRIRNFGTLRTRVGYSYNRFLVYVFEGQSFATTQNYFSTGNIYASSTVTRLPFRPAAYGIGVEYALTNNWSAKVEYMYDYINASTQIFAPAPRVNGVFLSRTTFDVVRAGLNYKFDWNATPVVARY